MKKKVRLKRTKKVMASMMLTSILFPNVEYDFSAASVSSSTGIACTGITANGTVDEDCDVSPVTFLNQGFEDPAIVTNNGAFLEDEVPGWDTTDPVGKIEIIKKLTGAGTGSTTILPYDGNQYNQIFESGAAALYQEFYVQPGQTIYYSFAHRGHFGADTMEVRGGIGEDITPTNPTTGGTSDIIVSVTDSYADWGFYAGSFEIPSTWDSSVPYRIAFTSPSTTGGNLVDAVNFSTKAIYDNSVSVSTSTDNKVTVTDDLVNLTGDKFGASSEVTITNDKGMVADPTTIKINGAAIDPASIVSNTEGSLVLNN